MRILALPVAAAAALSLGACTGPGYSDNDRQLQRAAGGAAIGAAVGAGVGAVVDGISPVQGAAVGGVAGGAIGAATSQHRWYRDGYGNCYRVDDRGRRIYDYRRRC
jgi:hypothetical protein